MEVFSLSSSADEQYFSDSIVPLLKQQAATLMRQLLTYHSLSSRVEESPSVHFVGCFLMAQIDLCLYQIQMFELIQDQQAAAQRQTTNPDLLCAVFRLLISYNSTRFHVTSSKVSDPTMPDMKPLTSIMTGLKGIINEQRDTLQTVVHYLKRWQNEQRAVIEDLAACSRWWKENNATLDEQCVMAEKQAGSSLSKNIEVGPTTKEKVLCTMGPLGGKKNFGIKSHCFILNIKMSLLFSKTSSHSYISKNTANRLRIARWPVDVEVKMFKGKALKGKEYAQMCPFTIQNRVYTANLIILPFSGCDVVLGNDWFASCESFVFEETCCRFKCGGIEARVYDTVW